MAAEATGSAAVAPSPGAGGLEPWQALSPAQLGQMSLPLPPDWPQGRPGKRTILLRGLGAFHVFIAVLNVVLGTTLIFVAESLHLVVLKSWYPFWGGASFLFTGISMIAMEMVPKTSVNVLCLTTQSISIFCALAGLIVIAKDLFLESSLESLVWRLLYPHRMVVHVQRLEVALFCFACLEFFLAGLTAIVTCRDYHLSAKKDDSALVPDMSLGFTGPPPSYEDTIRSDTQAEQSASEAVCCPGPRGLQPHSEGQGMQRPAPPTTRL